MSRETRPMLPTQKYSSKQSYKGTTLQLTSSTDLEKLAHNWYKYVVHIVIVMEHNAHNSWFCFHPMDFYHVMYLVTNMLTRHISWRLCNNCIAPQ